MIRIDLLVMGSPSKTLVFQDKEKSAAKSVYCEHMNPDRVFGYAQVTVDGKPLTLAQARKFFGLRAIIGHTPRKTVEDCKLPKFKWQKR